jgi:hypothetical protein
MTTDRLLALIAEFVARQQLVAEAITELRPDKFGIYNKNTPEVFVALADKVLHVPDMGTWKRYGRWRYFMHGAGCLLTNFITAEPLEWDAPHRHEFDPYWFINWCLWLRKLHPDDPLLTEAALKQALSALQAQGIIKQGEQGKLSLTTAD